MWRHFRLSQLGGCAPAIQWVEAKGAKFPTCKGSPPQTKNYADQNINNAKVENLVSLGKCNALWFRQPFIDESQICVSSADLVLICLSSALYTGATNSQTKPFIFSPCSSCWVVLLFHQFPKLGIPKHIVSFIECVICFAISCIHIDTFESLLWRQGLCFYFRTPCWTWHTPCAQYSFTKCLKYWTERSERELFSLQCR